MAGWRVIMALVASGVLLGPGGCMRVELADGPTAAALAPADRAAERWASPEAWPKRVTTWSGLRRTTTRALPDGRRPMGLVREVQGPIISMSDRPEVLERIRLEAQEDMRWVTGALRRASPRDLRVLAEGPGAYVFATHPSPTPEEVESARRLVYLKFISGEEEPAPGDPDRLHIRVQRTWMVVYPSRAAESRGLIVLAPGIFGTPVNVVEGLVARLQNSGWSVLRLASHSARFTERVDFAVNLDDPAPAAGQIAAELTDRAAECAYAVEAACLWLRERRPELLRGPRVLVGLSGGAMVGPTIVARDPDAWAGAVLVAGGTNFMRVALESSYANWVDALRFSFFREGDQGAVAVKPSEEDIRRLDALYLERAGIDSTFAARALLGKPVLIIHASGDSAVPAVRGEELWRILGRPQRWVFGSGHEILFLMLPGQFGRLTDWLSEQFPSAPTLPPAPATAEPTAPASPPPA